MATDTSKAIKRTAKPMTRKEVEMQKKIDYSMSKDTKSKGKKK